MSEDAIQDVSKSETMDETTKDIMDEIIDEATEEKETTTGYCKEHGKVEAIVKSGRPYCPVCHKIVSLKPPSSKKSRSSSKKKEASSSEESVSTDTEESSPIETADEDVIKPPDVEFIEEAIKFLEKNLPSVYGIDKKRVDAILKTIEQNPAVLHNPIALHMHIKNLAPRANDYHLSWIINAMYNKLSHLTTSQQGTMLPVQMQMQNLMPLMLTQPTPSPLHLMQLYQHYLHLQPNPYQPVVYPSPAQPQVASQTPSKKKTYKIVVDGQVIETDDPKEFFAWKEWIEKRKREEEEHQLRMKKLEEEIKKLAKERGEEKEKEKEKEEEERKKKMEDEVIKMLNSRIQSLEKMLSDLRKEREELKNKLEEMERKRQEERIQRLEAELRQLRDIASDPWKIIEAYESRLRKLGYTRTGKSLIDILDKGVEGIQNTVMELVKRLPQAHAQGRVVKYTEDERMEKIKQIKESIKESEERLEVEEELIKAAEKLYLQKEAKSEG